MDIWYLDHRARVSRGTGGPICPRMYGGSPEGWSLAEEIYRSAGSYTAQNRTVQTIRIR